MDPAIGASTWALGSHRCTPYNGIFTINAIMHANHRMLLDHEGDKGWVVRERNRKLSVPVEFWIEMRAIKSGMEPISV